jgi:hypothetical protein
MITIIIIIIIIIINLLMAASSDCFTHQRVLLVLQEPRHCDLSSVVGAWRLGGGNSHDVMSYANYV